MTAFDRPIDGHRYDGNLAPDEIVLLHVISPQGARMAKTLAVGPSGAWRVASAYGLPYIVSPKTHIVASIHDLARVLATASLDPSICAIRGGVRAKFADAMRAGGTARRLASDRPSEGAVAAFEERSRRWGALDLDAVPLPAGIDPIRDLDACLDCAITQLPDEFRDATVFYQFTSQHGIVPAARLRLWYWLDRPVSAAEAKLWLPGKPILDPATFNPVQPIYVAAPILPEGVTDFLPRRCGVRLGTRNDVPVPHLEALRAEIGRPRAARASRQAAPVPDREPVRAATMADALAMIGDAPGNPIGRGLHGPIKEAARLGICVERLDGPTVRAALETALLSCSHTRAPDYIETRLRDIPSLVLWFVRKRAETDAELAGGPAIVDPPTVPPMGTADEASAALAVAVRAGVERAGVTADARIDAILRQHIGLPPAIPEGEQLLAAAGIGIGKTQAAIAAIGAYLATPAPFRVKPRRATYIVPDHALAEGVAARFRQMFPAVPCHIHLGIERPDPDAPGFDDPTISDEAKVPMCRRLADALAITGAGGSVATLCGTAKRGFCPYHPDHPDALPETICGRQKQTTPKGGLLFLAGPEALTQTPPGSFKRVATIGEKRIALPHSDLLIVDEPKFHAMLGGCGKSPYDVTLAALTAPLRRFPGDPATMDDDVNAADAGDALGFLARELEALPPGPLLGRDVRRLAAARDWSRIRASALTFKADPKDFVKPSTPAKQLHDTLDKLKAHNGRLFAIARLTRILVAADAALADHPADAETGLIDRINVEIGGTELPAVRLRWVAPIADAWAGTPTLILDATADMDLVRRWYRDLAVIADAKAATPACVTRVQVHDSSFPYSSWVPDDATPPPDGDKSRLAVAERTRWNNIARLARLLVVRCAQYRGQVRDGIDVLAIVPQRTETALKHWFSEHGGKPASLATLHFNKLRGRDDFGGVRHLVMASRPLPKAPVLERLAWTISGVRGAAVADGLLPRVEGAYLMRDGTGRKALIARHPDLWAERVRAALCDAELLQAEGRGRAVRRMPDNPLTVEILTDVATPLEIDRLVTAEEALADSHPARWMVAAGWCRSWGQKEFGRCWGQCWGAARRLSGRGWLMTRSGGRSWAPLKGVELHM